jgi:hypothetical protein
MAKSVVMFLEGERHFTAALKEEEIQLVKAGVELLIRLDFSRIAMHKCNKTYILHARMF